MTNITFFSGGTGTPKLLDGARKVINEKDISVIVNTADDVEISGNLVCPDIDSVIYIFADLIDREKWWGIKEDTYTTHNKLVRDGVIVKRIEANREISKNRCFSGRGEFMNIGDKDRTTHILRTSLIDEGNNLTQATKKMTDSMNIEADILPMSNDPIATYIETNTENIHFQDFWIAKNCEPKIENVKFKAIENSKTTPEVLDALKSPVIIGPSNPITSISPIINLEKRIRELLKKTKVIAISPFIGGEIISGPAKELMKSQGIEASSQGVYSMYKDFLDILIVDNEKVKADCKVVELDTLMKSQEDSIRLFKNIKELLD